VAIIEAKGYFVRPERLVALFGVLAGLFATGMVAIAFSTGVTQEYFEAIHPAAEYAQKLKDSAAVLRVVFTLDNLFLLCYASFFMWFLVERRGKVDLLPANLLAICLFLAALLDAIENFHILAMLSRAELGYLPSDGEIELQYVLSAIKFIAGYFVAIVFGILYPRDTLLARCVGASTAIVFPIVGVLVFTTPPFWSELCGLGRFLFFALGYFLSTIVYWNRGAAGNLQ
jgi:hypothetical protein